MLRIVRYGAIAAIAVLALAWGVLWFGGDLTSSTSGTGTPVAGAVNVGGPFTLVAGDGHTVTDKDFRGKFMLVYFGYTFCPDVCPTELQVVAETMAQLGPLADRVVPVFITIDPERDTQEVMAGYVKMFDDRLIGLTGTPEQIAAAAKAYRVYYAKAKSKQAGDYLMDHSSFLYLMGPDGTLQTLFRPGTSGKEIAAAIRTRAGA